MFVKVSVLKNIILSVANKEEDIHEVLVKAKVPVSNLDDQDIEIDWRIGQDVWRVVEDYSGEENIGLKIGYDTPIESTGLVGMLAQSSPTIQKAWEEISAFYGLFTDMLVYACERKDSEFRISFQPAKEWTDTYPNTARQAISQAAIATCNIFSALTRKKLIPKSVHFTFDKPNRAEEYSTLFGDVIEYAQSSNTIIFHEEVADYKIISYASEVYLSLKNLCDEQVQNRLTRDNSIKSKVGKIILEKLDHGGCTLRDVARKLGYSERTLQRKLADEGVKFRTYYNELRMTIARQLLENGTYNVSEVADQLGYMEHSSFRKMFIQTFGKNPKQYQTDWHSSSNL